MPPSLRPLWLLACGLVSVLPGCGDLLSVGLPPSTATGDAVPLRVEVLRLTPSGPVSETAVAFGVAEPPRRSTLRFTMSGRVSEVTKQPGDRVVAGERLAGLFQAGPEAELGGLTARREAAREELAGMTRGVDSFGETERRSRLEQEIRTIDVRLQELGREIDLGGIEAPYDATVASRSIDVGDMVNAGAVAFEVFEDGIPVFEAHVPDRVAAVLSVGTSAIVALGSQQVAARIASVSPLLDRSSLTRLVRLTPTNATESLAWTPGESVEVRFRLPTDYAGYWLPMSALQGETGGLWSVYTVVRGDTGDELSRRAVNVLLLEEERVLVDGSIGEGDLVVSDGVHRVVLGQRVTPVLFDDNGQPTGTE
ncbi:MAG: HlyD family efflux transporter periplasmic adaptor subunit [Planctomycetota bacterium]